MLKAWTKSAKPQCLCGFPTLSYYNALVDSADDSCGFHIVFLRLLQVDSLVVSAKRGKIFIGIFSIFFT